MTSLFKKMNFKNHAHILLLNSPPEFEAELVAMQEFITVFQSHKDLESLEFVIAFVTQQVEIDAFMAQITPKLGSDAVLWFCYPKGSSKKYRCDFNRDTGWAIMGNYGLEPVRQVAVDADWSALRFRKVEHIKSFTRSESFALSQEGKNRATKK
ncbi:MAG: hypothetical protein EAZ57_05740 [Cytophagales bacterium]|nr:MAG: hypothetical protein EAZ67_06645 [Cytophagales bacterium]TAF60854.1 MAG: hypothetical protein EAZ57_05740 [Cytophagales bacterium]